MMHARRGARWKRVGTVVVVVGAIGASIMVWGEVEAWAVARNQLRLKEREWRALGGNVELAQEGLAAIEAEMEARRAEIARWWAASRLGRVERDAEVSGRTEEAFFELAGFVERMRERAAANGVNVKEGERFGFAEFTAVGPERERIAEVMRQRELAEAVLSTLFEAAPEELVACERGESEASERRVREMDTFGVDRRWSLGADEIRATAYRVRFVGRTDVLRKLLNGLAEAALPMAVTSVDVEPVKGAAAVAGADEGRFVASGGSEFSVTVERLDAVIGGELASIGAGRSEERAEGVAAPRWEAPVVNGDAEWGYDLFTPPEIFYDAALGRWSARRIEKREGERIENLNTPAAAAFELVRTKVEPFRVQLVGFVETGEGEWGVFEDAETAGVVLAGAGKRLAELEVAIETLVVERAERVWPESMAVNVLVAKAKVRDERTGGTLWLTNVERAWVSDPVAVVKRIGGDEERVVRVGDEIAGDDAAYRVIRIEQSPPAIELAVVSEGKVEAVRRMTTAR